MDFPNFADLAAAVFNARPADVSTLRRLCDETDALRAAKGEDDPGVQAGEVAVNNLKGMFTRRIAWACHQHDPRFGLRRKTSGQLATRPVDGVTHSTDALMLSDSGQIVDAMSDRNWSWGVSPGDTQPIDQWLAPLPEVGDGVPLPDPGPIVLTPPPAASADLGPILARLFALEQYVTEGAPMVESLRQRVLNLEQLAASTPLGLPALVAVGHVHLFGFDYNVRLPVEKA